MIAFCWLPPDMLRAIGDGALTAADVELLNEPVGIFAHGVAADEAAVLELRLLVTLEHHVLLEREVEHEAVLVPVLGDVAHILAAAGDGGMRDVLAAER